jgi:hypothetical protein
MTGHYTAAKRLHRKTKHLESVAYLRRIAEGQDETWIAWFHDTGNSLSLIETSDSTATTAQARKVCTVKSREEAVTIAKEMGRRKHAEGYRYVRTPQMAESISVTMPVWKRLESVLQRHGLCVPRAVPNVVDIVAPRCKPLDIAFGTTFYAAITLNGHAVTTLHYNLCIKWEEDDPDRQELLDLRWLSRICHLVTQQDDPPLPFRRKVDAIDELRKNRARLSPEVVAAAIDLGLLPTAVDFTGIPSRHAWNLV